MNPEDFKHGTKLILSLLILLTDNKYLSWMKLPEIYAKFWNPVNYAVIGGIGVVINYAVWFILSSLTGLPWFLINGIAIILAWSWNWMNSVGPLGYLWGFRQKESETISKKLEELNAY